MGKTGRLGTWTWPNVPHFPPFGRWADVHQKEYGLQRVEPQLLLKPNEEGTRVPLNVQTATPCHQLGVRWSGVLQSGLVSCWLRSSNIRTPLNLEFPLWFHFLCRGRLDNWNWGPPIPPPPYGRGDFCIPRLPDCNPAQPQVQSQQRRPLLLSRGLAGLPKRPRLFSALGGDSWSHGPDPQEVTL